MLTDTNADGITYCIVNNLEETKEENINSIERNCDIIDSESSTSSDNDLNFMLNQKMKLSMMQTCFNKNETLADWLDFDINPSYLNEFKRKEIIVDEH